MKIRKMTKSQVYEEMKRLITVGQHGSKRFEHLMNAWSGGKQNFVYHFGAIKFTRENFLVIPSQARKYKISRKQNVSTRRKS